MLPAQIEQQLSHIEFQATALSQAVNEDELQALEAVAAELRQAAVELTRSVQGLGLDVPAMREFKLRLKKVVLDLAVQRGGLVRRAAATERALHAMVPATRETTYAPSKGPYGGVGRQSGAFKLLVG